MFFFTPFIFLFPLLFIYLAARVGSRIFREYLRDRDREKGDWRNVLDPFRSTDLKSGFKNLSNRNPRSVEARIFRLAHKLKGRITISDIVVEIGLDIKSAEEAVNSMVDGMRVCMEVDERGLVMYEFPEIISRFEGN